MDPSPRPYAERDRDREFDVPVPFACGTTPYAGPAPDPGSPTTGHPSIRHLDGRRVTQCALSRVCGACGVPLGRPLAFIGSPDEAERNAFHFPACHVECAQALLDAVAYLRAPVLGQPETVTSWVLTTTPAFEYVRPGREDDDRRPTFQPYEVLTQTR
jgi:hypothetical protein